MTNIHSSHLEIPLEIYKVIVASNQLTSPQYGLNLFRSFFLSPPNSEFPLTFNAAAASAFPFVMPRILGTDIPPPMPLPFPFGMRCIPVVCNWDATLGPLGPPPTLAAKPPRKSVKPLSAVMLVRALMAPGLASN